MEFFSSTRRANFLGWHVNLKLFKFSGNFSRFFSSFHFASIKCMYERKNWIIEFQILKRFKIDFTQFNWQTDSLIEIDNVVNGEKIDSRRKRSRWKWNIHAVLLVWHCLPGVNRRNYVTRWNFIENFL